MYFFYILPSFYYYLVPLYGFHTVYPQQDAKGKQKATEKPKLINWNLRWMLSHGEQRWEEEMYDKEWMNVVVPELLVNFGGVAGNPARTSG